jgi:hypothetical protein
VRERLRGDDRPGVDELFTNNVYAQVQTFEGACAKQNQIVRFREDDIIRSCGTRRVDDCVSDITLDVSAVGHDESLAPLNDDVERFKHMPWDPRELTPGVNHHIPQLATFAPLRDILDADGSA